MLAAHKPRLYITTSGIHNPTGATLSPVVAHRVLKLAEMHGLTIIEDDIFADFEMTAAPRLAAFDGLDRVIQIGSFSKTLSAASRCGFVAARQEWIEGLTDLKIATSFGGGRLNAELALNVLSDSGYRKHLDGLRSRLAKARRDVGRKLLNLGIKPWIEPQAGMFLWCTLPDGADAADVARGALAHNVVLAPGNAFSLAQEARSYIRFNVSQSGDERIFRGARGGATEGSALSGGSRAIAQIAKPGQIASTATRANAGMHTVVKLDGWSSRRAGGDAHHFWQRWQHADPAGRLLGFRHPQIGGRHDGAADGAHDIGGHASVFGGRRDFVDRLQAQQLHVAHAGREDAGRGCGAVQCRS